MRNLIVGAVLFSSSIAEARPPSPPIPVEQWTPQAHVWLSRAMVAEAGWKSKSDHVAIAYVLARRWKRAVDRWPTLRFVDIIRNYCAGLGSFRRSLTSRQRWLRALSLQPDRPDGWPSGAAWRRYQPLWGAALQRSQRWSRGELRDPCRGRAWHWGGTIDSPHGRMVAVDCGQTRNTFYGMQDD